MKTTTTVYHVDNREVLKRFADATFHAIVTDPPYELGFMGKKWDSSGIAYDRELWQQCLRVLKPGGYVLAFGGSRTYHRLACAIEDAGFEIRDMIEWLYGSGFPKSMDVSKAMDKAAGKENVIGTKPDRWTGKGNSLNFSTDREQSVCKITAPVTADAKLWQGWGTALKPAHEPICIARKPLEGTVAENVLKHGVGAINIDACRIGTDDTRQKTYKMTSKGLPDGCYNNPGKNTARIDMLAGSACGRFPANLILDPIAAAMLDAQSGDQCGAAAPVRKGHSGASKGIYQDFASKGDDGATFRGDTGGASRFFYTAKASGTDRGNNVKGALPLFGVEEEEFRNTHPTVKPLALMRYLLKLVCPTHLNERIHVLDPFLGSGTTAVACRELGIDVTGIELEADHIAIIRERCPGATIL